MKPKPRYFSLILDGLSVALLCAAVWLFWDARATASDPLRSRYDGDPTSGVRVKVGDTVPGFSVADPDESEIPGLLPGQKGHLVYVFKSDCPACAEQKAEWKHLAADVHSIGIRVVAYTPETLHSIVHGYFGDTPLSVMRFTDMTAASAALDIRVVPTTFLLDSDGRVIHHHEGILPRAALDSIRYSAGKLAAE